MYSMSVADEEGRLRIGIPINLIGYDIKFYNQNFTFVKFAA